MLFMILGLNTICMFTYHIWYAEYSSMTTSSPCYYKGSLHSLQKQPCTHFKNNLALTSKTTLHSLQKQPCTHFKNNLAYSMTASPGPTIGNHCIAPTNFWFATYTYMVDSLNTVSYNILTSRVDFS